MKNGKENGIETGKDSIKKNRGRKSERSASSTFANGQGRILSGKKRRENANRSNLKRKEMAPNRGICQGLKPCQGRVVDRKQDGGKK